MKANSNLIRSAWPKVRIVEIKGSRFFQVDARRKGSLGKRETFADRKEAENRADVLADTLKVHGASGLALSAALREMALEGDKFWPHLKGQRYGKPANFTPRI